MKTLSKIIIFLLLMPIILLANDEIIEINYTGEELIETEPAKSLSIAFIVTNKTSTQKEFIPDIKLPNGWNLIIGETPFSLKANETDVELLTFHIPISVVEGKYEVVYSVKTTGKDSVPVADYTLHVSVASVSKISVKLLSAPGVVIAGDEYQASFTVVNASNGRRTIDIDVESSENWKCKIDSSEIEFAPAESKNITVTVGTDKRIQDKLDHRIRLTARNNGTNANATCAVKIIPRISSRAARFRNLPTQISLVQEVNKDDRYEYRFRPEIYTSGALDKNEKTNLTLLYRGHDIQDKTTPIEFYRKIPDEVFNKDDVYRANLWTKNFELQIGDWNHSFSCLSGVFMGRGIKSALNIKRFVAQAYYENPSWSESNGKVIAGHIGYSDEKRFQLGINADRTMTGAVNKDIVSLNGSIKPINNTDIGFEYALGGENGKLRWKDGDAYLIKGSGFHRRISYSINYLHRSPDFSSSYTDGDIFSARIGLPILRWLKLNGDFHESNSNLNIDTTLGSAVFERNYHTGFDIRLPIKTTLSCGYEYRLREDKLPEPEFDYQQKIGGIGIRQSFGWLSFSGSVEYGNMWDKTTNQNSAIEKFYFFTQVKPTRWWSSRINVRYRNNDFYTGEEGNYISADIQSKIDIGRSVSLDVKFQSDGCREYFEEYNIGNENLYQAKLNILLPFRHEISLSGWHVEYRDSSYAGESALKLEYTIPFGIPVGIKKDTGKLSGNVFDDETGEPISNAVIRLNGYTAVTDKNGNFIFPAVETGEHYLYINTSSIGLDRIPIEKTLMKIDVKSGKNKEIKIGMTQGASVSGRITLFKFAETQYDTSTNIDDKEIIEVSGMFNIMVELSNSSESIRRVTDTKGEFVFEELRPGNWTLRIYKDDIPEYHYIEKDRFEVELQPGTEEKFDIRIIPRKRHIKIIEQGGNLNEE